MKDVFTMGAFVVILNKENQILLCLRNDKDTWNLPGGRVEKKESPWDAVIREANEEMGVVISVDEIIGVHYKQHDDDLVFTFLGKIIEGSPVVTEESKEIQFFSMDNLPHNMAPKQKERIIAWKEKGCLVWGNQ